MLRSFLKIISSLVFVAIFPLAADAMLFKATNVTAENFQKMALRKNQPTFTQWFLDKTMAEESEVHPQVADFSQMVMKENGKISKQRLEDWKYLRNVIDLNRADREMFYMLAEKLNLKNEMCRYALLDPDLVVNSEVRDLCLQVAERLPAPVLAQLEARDLLVIDGKAFRKDQVPQAMMSGSYQWKIISDHFQKRSFIGTAVDFGKQKFHPMSWVNGDCDNYKLNQEDFSVLTQAEIMFDETCVVPGLQPPKTFKTWTEEHKTLLWTIGILAAGLTAYQMKDKTLVITRF